jgi:hypothetical protein
LACVKGPTPDLATVAAWGRAGFCRNIPDATRAAGGDDEGMKTTLTVAVIVLSALLVTSVAAALTSSSTYTITTTGSSSGPLIGDSPLERALGDQPNGGFGATVVDCSQRAGRIAGGRRYNRVCRKEVFDGPFCMAPTGETDTRLYVLVLGRRHVIQKEVPTGHYTECEVP